MGFLDQGINWSGESLEEMTERITNENARARLAWAKQMEKDQKALRLRVLNDSYAPTADVHRSPGVADAIRERLALQGPAIDTAQVLSMLNGTTTLNLTNKLPSQVNKRDPAKYKAGTEGQERTRNLRAEKEEERAGPTVSALPGTEHSYGPATGDAPEDAWQRNMREAQERQLLESRQPRPARRTTNERAGMDVDEKRRQALRRGFKF